MDDQQFENLVFEGGGVKGIAYVGSLKVMEEKGILQNIKRVGGTSAGAITATLLALDYSLEEIQKILWNLDFEDFLDSSWGVIRNTNRLVNEYGWYKGDYFEKWIGEKIERKLGSRGTFNALRVTNKPLLYICGTNLSTGFTEVFSPEHTPRMSIAKAVRISMSLPLFFASMRKFGHKYVDGGVQRNYPVKLFDRLKYIDEDKRGAENNGYDRKTEYYERENQSLRGERENESPLVYNKATLGFKLDEKEKIRTFLSGDISEAEEQIDDFFDYTSALVRSVMQVQANQHLHSDDWQRTVYIDTLGVGTADFGIEDDRKQDLVDSGRKHTEEYFEWFENLENDPAINNCRFKEHDFYT